MNVASINKQALAQTYYILDGLSKTSKNKIPYTLITTISENMDKQYTNSNELLEETKEILYAILNKYVLSQSQKDKLAEYYRYYDARMEEEKLKKYQYKNIFKNNRIDMENTEEKANSNEFSLLPYKENLFVKILNKLKNFFYKK